MDQQPDEVRVDEGGSNAEPPASILEDAEWYAANHTRHYQAFRRLREYTDTHGPIRLQNGKALGLFSDGNEWDHTGIVNEFPALATEMSITLIGPVKDVYRAVDVATEEVPTVKVGPAKFTLDRDAANGILSSEAAPRLKQHIHPKPGRLQVK